MPRRKRSPLTRDNVKRALTRHDGVLLTDSTYSDNQSAEVTTIQVPDMTQAQKLAAVLRDVDGIEAAYAKPGEELP